jgi:LacI family transcriptional regulator
MVSIRDVAEHAGVAISTVSKFMNTPERVAPDTRVRVARAIDALGYVRNEAARQLRAGESRIVTFIAMELNNPFFGDVAEAMERRASASGLYLHIASCNGDAEREARYIEMLVQQRVFGVLLSSGRTRRSELDLLAQRRIPTVLVDAYGPSDQFSSVSIDDHYGARLAVEHLISQGCTRIAFVGSDLHIHQLAERAHGAQAAVAAHPGVTLEIVSGAERSVTAGRAAGDELLERPRDRRPDGIFAANDLLAIGLLDALLKGGVSVPEDIALVGYDDIEFTRVAPIAVTSVHRPREPFGRTAIDLLVEESDAAESAQRTSVVIRPELVVRASSQRLR